MKGGYLFELNEISSSDYFPEFLIKDKVQIIGILMEALRLMLFTPFSMVDGYRESGKNKIILKIDRTSRLYFVSKSKIYSIVFPFRAAIDEEKLKFYTQNDYELTSELISIIKEIIIAESFSSHCCLDFSEPIFERQNDNDEIWNIIRELILIEDGYLRFDKDPDNFGKFNELGQSNRHPLNHFDIFYSKNVSFKLGLRNEITFGEFMDIIDSKSDCKFLH